MKTIFATLLIKETERKETNKQIIIENVEKLKEIKKKQWRAIESTKNEIKCMYFFVF